MNPQNRADVEAASYQAQNTTPTAPATPVRGNGTVSWGRICVNLVGGFARIDDRVIDLQPLQLRILAFLALHGGAIVTASQLREQVFRVAQGARSTSIARQISVLRARLGSARNLLNTVPGGYRLRQISPDDDAGAFT